MKAVFELLMRVLLILGLVLVVVLTFAPILAAVLGLCSVCLLARLLTKIGPFTHLSTRSRPRAARPETDCLRAG